MGYYGFFNNVSILSFSTKINSNIKNLISGVKFRDSYFEFNLRVSSSGKPDEL